MTVKEQVLLLLEEQKNVPISGEDIAEKLGCTRASVWKAVKGLQAEGYQVSAVTNKGYTLTTSADVLSKAYIEDKLKNEGVDIVIETRKVVDSTNEVLKTFARDGMVNDCVLVSEEQTAGKGRRGRSFYSPAQTGIYLSFLLHPNVSVAEAPMLTTIAATALAKAIEKVTNVETGIKWVNDIWVRGKKTCGILTEASTSIEDGSLDYVIVGIGINIYEPEGGFPEDIKDIAGSIFEDNNPRENLRNKIVAELIASFMKYYATFPDRAYLDDYRKRCFVIGKEVSFVTSDHQKMQLPENRQNALVIGIDDDCHLHVRYSDGVEEYLSSGEISVRL